MKGKRSRLDFKDHIFESKTFRTEEGSHMNVYTLHRPDTNCGLIRMIVGFGITTVTGDYGDWVFGREFHPSEAGYCSDDYWLGKLSKHDSEASGVEFDADDTRAELESILGENWQLDHLGRELTGDEEDYIKDCINATYDGCEFAYLAVAYRDNVGYFEDPESVIHVTKTKPWLLTIFDAFDEMCERLTKD